MADYNDGFRTLFKGIGQVADDIKSSSFMKNVLPSASEFGNEMQYQIKSNEKIRIQDPLVRSELHRKLTDTVDIFLNKAGVDVNKEIIDEITGFMKKSNYTDADLERVASLMKKHNVSDELASKFKKITKEDFDKTIKSKEFDPSPMKPSLGDILGEDKEYSPGMINRIGFYANTYFNNPDAKVRQQRLTAVVGGYAAVNIGGRLLSGGGITHDNYGRRDIAGIPFI